MLGKKNVQIQKNLLCVYYVNTAWPHQQFYMKKSLKCTHILMLSLPSTIKTNSRGQKNIYILLTFRLSLIGPSNGMFPFVRFMCVLVKPQFSCDSQINVFLGYVNNMLYGQIINKHRYVYLEYSRRAVPNAKKHSMSYRQYRAVLVHTLPL